MGHKFIKASLLATLSLRALAESDTTDYDPIISMGSSNAEDVGSYEYNLFEEGNTHPNSTRSVSFKPFEWFTQEPEIADREWTWRVNVSDFAVPNAEGDLEDPHVVNTAYDLSWEGGGNISSAMGNSTDSLCASILALDFPPNVTNAYTDDNTDSPDCTPVLGQECVDAILSQGDGVAGSGACRGPATSWTLLPECASTIGYAASLVPYASIVTSNINSGNSTANYTSPVNGTDIPNPNRASGQGFYGKSSGAIDGANATVYYNATNQLQVLMLNTQVRISGGSSTGSPSLLCMRVNTTSLSTGEDGSEDGSGNGSGDDEGAGPMVRVSLGMTCSAMLAVVASVAYFM